MKPRLWGRRSSVNVQKVLWTLAEIGIDYERIDAGFTYGRTNTDAFAVLNPNKKVPVWQEDGLTLWESHAIVRHLVNRNSGLIAHDALADQWMEFVNSTLQPPFIGIFYQRVRLPVGQRSDTVFQAQSKALNAALAVVEDRLAAVEWLNGDRFSTADLVAGAPMHRVFDVKWPRENFPATEKWLRCLRARPAYRDTVMSSYEELQA